MTDCIFCKIVAGDIPSEKVFEDEQLYVFKDIDPKAAVHLLIIPKTHIARLDEMTSTHRDLIADMMLKLPELARSQGLDNGFRTIINTGPGGGQEVDHVHIHLLGGQGLPGFH